MIANTPFSAFVIGFMLITKIGLFLFLLFVHIWFNANLFFLNQDFFCLLNSSYDLIWHRFMQGLSFGLLFSAIWTIIKICRATALQLLQFKKQQISYENMPLKLHRLANKYRLSDKLYFIKSEQWIALTIGFINPRILISEETVKQLDDLELEAVLLHEIYHQQMRDPLLLLVVYTLTKMMFFVSGIKGLQHTFITWKEIRADGYARTKMKTEKPLISALIKMIHSSGNIGVIKNGSLIASSFQGGGINLRLAYLLNHRQYINKYKVQLPLKGFVFLTLFIAIATIIGCV